MQNYAKGFISLIVEQENDLGSHVLFICRPTEGKLLSDEEAITYSYYQKNVKPSKKPEKKKGYVCRICGYVYEGETLPDDFVCPICKHGPEDFEPM